MIDVKIGEKGPERATFAGDLADVGADMLFIVHQLYSGLCKSSEAGAKEFRRKFTIAIADPESEVWKANENAQGIFYVKEERK